MLRGDKLYPKLLKLVSEKIEWSENGQKFITLHKKHHNNIIILVENKEYVNETLDMILVKYNTKEKLTESKLDQANNENADESRVAIYEML